MKRVNLYIAPVLLILSLGFSCSDTKRQSDSKADTESETVIKRRDDGTLSSVNQVDEEGRVNGMRVTYYPDGKTIYSKLTYEHGIKQGPSIRYYDNGQVFEYTGFGDGKKNGLTRKYYKDGMLLSECEYENGNVLPGLKEYDSEGNLIKSYPEIRFREINRLATRDRIDLQVYCTERNRGVKYFLLDQTGGGNGRTYLISENSSAMLQYYLKPGGTLDKRVDIIAEIPTQLGNVMARKVSYHLSATN
jgi:hypothetical protein